MDNWVDRHFPETDTPAWAEWKAKHEERDHLRARLLDRREVETAWWHRFVVRHP